MTSLGKRSSSQYRNKRSVAIKGATLAAFDIAETTPVFYCTAPMTGRAIGISYQTVEAIDVATVVTVLNTVTGESTTATFPVKAITLGGYVSLAAELPVSEGDFISFTSAGTAATGQVHCDLVFVQESP